MSRTHALTFLAGLSLGLASTALASTFIGNPQMVLVGPDASEVVFDAPASVLNDWLDNGGTLEVAYAEFGGELELVAIEQVD